MNSPSHTFGGTVRISVDDNRFAYRNFIDTVSFIVQNSQDHTIKMLPSVGRSAVFEINIVGMTEKAYQRMQELAKAYPL